MKRTTLYLLAATLLLCGCKRTHEDVVATYPDGSPHIVNIMKGKGDKAVRVGEKMYYMNGQLWADRHFDGSTFVGEWKFYHPNGKLYAKGTFDKNHQMGRDWSFQDSVGNPFLEGNFDSVCLMELPPNGIPVSLAYYRKDTAFLLQFYDDFKIRAQGTLVSDLRQGVWTYYYPNGNTQAEAAYINGVENGKHNTFRENGIPFYLGFYINGQRAGVWEFYDEYGDLAGTQNFDTPFAEK